VQKYYAIDLSTQDGPLRAAVYRADEADARIAAAEKIMRDELLIDVGQQEEQGYCMACGHRGPTVATIEHANDCALNIWLARF
jgi:hypothetical protein